MLGFFRGSGACSLLSSAHIVYVLSLLNAPQEGDTHLMMKQLNPVRLYKNGFYQQVRDTII
jgi:hypothetical protein